jgi:DNA invertase Pin-like site-specific DNA recombinase
MASQNIGYIRVSTTKQNTDRQLDGVALDKVFEDKMTGSSLDRPELEKCLNYVRSGDTLHVHSIDRLARNLKGLEELIDGLVTKGVTVIFHHENMAFNGGDDAMSKLMLQMLGAFAEFERSMAKTRIKEGLAIARTKGKKVGRPPVNYGLRDEILKRKANGDSFKQIAKDLGIGRTSLYKIIA